LPSWSSLSLRRVQYTDHQVNQDLQCVTGLQCRILWQTRVYHAERGFTMRIFTGQIGVDNMFPHGKVNRTRTKKRWISSYWVSHFVFSLFLI
jgi:hypothetical protein